MVSTPLRSCCPRSSRPRSPACATRSRHRSAARRRGSRRGSGDASASDLAIPDAIAAQLGSGTVPEEQLEGIRQLLDALAANGHQRGSAGGARADPPRLHGLRPGDAVAGISALRGLTFLLFYALPDETTGRNANWEAIGYPGPRAVAALARRGAEDDPGDAARRRTDLALTADVVVVGSGSGRRGDRRQAGGRRAGRRRARGRRLLQRGGLQPVRALGLPEPLPQRWVRRDGQRPDHAHDRARTGRRLDRELDELPAHLPVGPRAVGARVRARRPRRRGLRAAPRRGLQAHQRQRSLQRLATAPTSAWTRRAASWASTSAASRATPTRAVTTPTSPGSWASATSAAPSSAR